MLPVTDQTVASKPVFPYRLLGSKDSAGTLRDLLAEAPGPDAAAKRSRLQALLGQWLRMENVVMLLASGCSAGARVGGKLLGGLEDSSLALLQAKYASDSSPVRQLCAARATQRQAKKDFHLELWLSEISTLYKLVSSPSEAVRQVSWSGIQLSKDVLHSFLTDVERTIYAQCALTLPALHHGEGPTGHHAFFAKLISRDPALGRAHVFTLNYDTAIEQALDHLGIQYCDGFSGRTEARFDPSGYGLDVYWPGDVGEGRVRRFDKFLHLYKLHGSIHWEAHADGAVTARHPNLLRFRGWTEKTPAEQAQTLDGLWGDDASAPRVAILPTAAKYAQTLEMPYGHLFRLFHQRLQSPQTFFLVIGYGFGDEHVNRIIDVAMTNPSLVTLMVTPSYSEDDQAGRFRRLARYQDLGERVFVLCPVEQASGSSSGRPRLATFDDFALNLMPDVRWLDDLIRLRRFEQTVGRIDHQEDPDRVE